MQRRPKKRKGTRYAGFDISNRLAHNAIKGMGDGKMQVINEESAAALALSLSERYRR